VARSIATGPAARPALTTPRNPPVARWSAETRPRHLPRPRIRRAAPAKTAPTCARAPSGRPAASLAPRAGCRSTKTAGAQHYTAVLSVCKLIGLQARLYPAFAGWAGQLDCPVALDTRHPPPFFDGRRSSLLAAIFAGGDGSDSQVHAPRGTSPLPYMYSLSQR
jgi:hypothetical protein